MECKLHTTVIQEVKRYFSPRIAQPIVKLAGMNDKVSEKAQRSIYHRKFVIDRLEAVIRLLRYDGYSLTKFNSLGNTTCLLLANEWFFLCLKGNTAKLLPTRIRLYVKINRTIISQTWKIRFYAVFQIRCNIMREISLLVKELKTV
jgi:hypothetical protein